MDAESGWPVGLPLWSRLNYLNNYWIAMTFYRDFRCAQRVNPSEFPRPLTLPLVPTAGFTYPHKYLNIYMMDCQKHLQPFMVPRGWTTLTYWSPDFWSSIRLTFFFFPGNISKTIGWIAMTFYIDFMVPRGWIFLTLLVPWLYLWCQLVSHNLQKYLIVSLMNCPKAYTNVNCAQRMNRTDLLVPWHVL